MIQLPRLPLAAAIFGLALATSLTSARAAVFPDPAVDAPLAAAPDKETTVFAGGCFWGIQAVFEHVKGVIRATAGYAGGEADTAHYEMVSTGATGHAESVQVEFDPSKVTYGQLLKVFFAVAHDPTELNYQGPDQGTQYRSAIFYATAEQQRIARAYIDQLDRAKVFPHPLVTQVTPLSAFYPAEAYHQDYLVHHPTQPYIVFNDLPKLYRLQERLPELYVEYKPAS